MFSGRFPEHARIWRKGLGVFKMVFSSLEFVCVFLPLVFLLYCILPGIRSKNALLIVASLLFYAYGEPQYVLLMIFSAWFNYLSARVMVAGRRKRCFLFANAAVNLGLLAFFKYTAFFMDTWNQISGMQVKVLEIELPIGISFFTFQALSYVVDVYRGAVPVQKSFWKVLLYISFFPQLIAGPIVKYRDIAQALTDRKMDIKQVSDGLRRFICGLGKKILIANTMGQAADAVFQADYTNVNMLAAWIGALSYMLQIYYDFSGYSDMAIGLGKMFGFSFRENFQYPYGASSIKEFWARWHISLSTWFKEYLYIPLGGNRKGKLRTGINKFIVFFCTGLWHGANWTFVFWGLYHGFFSVLEGWLPCIKKIPKPIRYLYTMFVVCTGFVIFRADTISQGIYINRQMFAGTSFGGDAMSFAAGLLTPWLIIMFLAGLFGMAPVRPLAERIREIVYVRKAQPAWSYRAVQVFLYAASVVVLLWCMVRLSGNTYNPFIYFRF